MAEEVIGDADVVASTGLGGGIGELAIHCLVALVTLRYGRGWWLSYQGLFSLGIAGTVVASPKFAFGTAMGSLIGEYDDCHNIVIRAYGILFFITSGLILHCRNSSDKRGVSAMLEGLSMSLALEIICHVPFLGMDKNVGKLMHDPEKGLYFFAGILFGNIAHLLAGESGYSDIRTPSACNFNSRFDAMAQLMIGCSLYAFPKGVLAVMTNNTDFDSAQVVTTAVIGCYYIGNSVVSFQAESFNQEDTRKYIYSCRIIECVSMTVLILLNWAFTDILTPISLIAVPMNGILAVNAFITMNSAPTKVKK